MTREISFFIPGVPGTKGNWVADARCARGMRPSYSKKLDRWKRAIAHRVKAWAGQRWRLHTEPVHVDIEFRFRRPASHIGKRGLRKAGRGFPAPTGHGIGDGDKLTRAVWDELVPRVVGDDSMIASWSGAKRWCEPGEEPGAMITIRDHEPNNRPDGPESEQP